MTRGLTEKKTEDPDTFLFELFALAMIIGGILAAILSCLVREAREAREDREMREYDAVHPRSR